MPYKDPEVRRQFLADYYHKNQTTIKARSRQFYRTHKEEQLAKQKRRYQSRSPEERERLNAKSRRHRLKVGPDKMWERTILSKYGITADEYYAILDAQDSCCAICGKGVSEEGRRLSIDHCHNTNSVRGLLCKACNKGLGAFRDDVESLLSAAEYLMGFKQRWSK